MSIVSGFLIVSYVNLYTLVYTNRIKMTDKHWGLVNIVYILTFVYASVYKK